ncbi:class II aldolase/adducin family protein [candidate division KSB1 bacterium]|nr:class II aldolase/adducin family protein [candidate division KSB1 bacterium]NIR71243.1 class II aldolase/adducin family protein [candidate division KSB1 bacterium]NIS26184.1 class II aldolase/adducin family protein [candidate division KSB1 bacterium]NIT72962.1 class II aldolase/adducin family protein [candidate division KSB1 bacterium]NIU26831.1 class II aldolase/adducin family protein [candidate division KSB1 bacterium]
MASANETQLRQALVEAGRRMYNRGYVAANDGNISVRLDNERILTTPTGVSKGFMSADSMVVVDLRGKSLSSGKPSTELPMHLYVYTQRSDVHAVVHAHPPHATGFATAGLALDKCVLAEVIVTIGTIPLAEYGTPSTGELPQTLAPYIHSCEAFLMANHGVVTVGKDLMDAYFKMERVEHYAKIIFIARALGGERVLSKEQVEKLYDLRETYGATSVNPGCYACYDECIGETCVNHDVKHDPGAPDYFGEVVEKVLAAVR